MSSEKAQHDDPLKLKFDENSWIFHLYLAKGPKITILMRCGFICDIGVAVRGAKKTKKVALVTVPVWTHKKRRNLAFK